MADGTHNLIPRQKGDPKVPNSGRKKGTKNKKTRIREFLEMFVKFRDNEGREYKGKAIELIISSLMEKAITQKDVPAIKEVFDRYYGKVTDKVETKNTNVNIEATHKTLDKIMGSLGSDED
jgi:hypothetical protein